MQHSIGSSKDPSPAPPINHRGSVASNFLHEQRSSQKQKMDRIGIHRATGNTTNIVHLNAQQLNLVVGNTSQ
jgi:hypothetical protein